MSDQEKKNTLGSHERLCEHVIFMKFFKMFDIVPKAWKSIITDILMFLKNFKLFWLLENALSLIFKKHQKI